MTFRGPFPPKPCPDSTTARAHVQRAVLKLGHRRLKLQRSAWRRAGQRLQLPPSPSIFMLQPSGLIFLLTELPCPPSALCRISLMLLWLVGGRGEAGGGGHKTASYFYFIPPLGFEMLSRICSWYLHVTPPGVTQAETTLWGQALLLNLKPQY